ncbi:MAG: hypothetical protein IJR27_06230 [Synergistaceae bacterium]|nr:hypothetical protein [Synergistaceae bacterium]
MIIFLRLPLICLQRFTDIPNRKTEKKGEAIDDGFPNVRAAYSVVRGPYGGTYHWIMVADTQISFFVYRSAYGSRPLINLFREIASSVRRDLGLGRVNILPSSQEEDE